MAPAKLRGGLNILFQVLVGCVSPCQSLLHAAAAACCSRSSAAAWRWNMRLIMISFLLPPQLMVTIGILVAQLINYGTQHHSWGWRVSLAIAFIPAFILFWGASRHCAGSSGDGVHYWVHADLWCTVLLLRDATHNSACWTPSAAHKHAPRKWQGSPLPVWRCVNIPPTGGVLLPETPNSLIERGHLEEAQRVLRKIRGTDNIRVEYEDILLVRLQELEPAQLESWLRCKAFC